MPKRIVIAALIVGALLVGVPGCGGSGTDTQSVAAVQARERLEDARRELHVQKLEEELQQVQRSKRIVERERAKLQPVTREAEEPADSGSAPASGLSGFSQLEASLPGEVGVAIGPPGSPPAATGGSLTTGSAWSTSKVPVVMRVLAETGGPDGLSATQQDEVRRALTLSDNEAALALFGDLEASHGGAGGAAAAVDEVLAEAGDTATQVSSVGRDGFTPFGQTEWSLALQEQFMSMLAAGCVGSPESAEYVLGLMGEVSSDTWGLGSAGLPARWKGGWGPGTDGRYLTRQMGILEVEGREAIVTLAALPEDGSFETGQSMATSLAQFLAKQAPKYAGTPSGC
ncbi:MAG TPA: hypothetical protein VLL27_14310 [Solirubrobacterales bacterium]|nr:hypothetical protein [Solirubrobacterales bacterium]